MLSANVEWQAQAAKPRITVAIRTGHKMSDETEASAEKEGEKDRKRELGVGKGCQAQGRS